MFCVSGIFGASTDRLSSRTPKKKRGWATLSGRFRLLTTRWRISIAGVIARWTPNSAASAGEILLKRDPANPGPAEEALKAAIAIAQQQGARSFELRAALSLAKLYQSTGRPADAHAVLAPALEGFTPTPEMPEIAEAQALLAALSQPTRSKRKPRSGSD